MTMNRKNWTQGTIAAASAALLPIMMLSAASAPAQVGSASLSGTVQDPTGALVPGAVLKLKNENNNAVVDLKSDAKGLFSFFNLQAGTYDLTVTAPGFRPAQRNGIVLHIGDAGSLNDLKLAIESGGETTTVTADSGEVTPTTSGEQSYTLTGKQIQNLNIEGRSAIELLGLVPGAANSGNFNSNSYEAPTEGFTQNSSAFSVNGNRFDLVAVVSDGAPVTDVNTAGASAVTPNVDNIAESKVSTAAFSSEQPNGPIVFSTETKSGGKDFHGEAYITVRNHVLDDTDWRVKFDGLPKPDDSYYYPGGNIGGPVLIPGTGFNRNRDKLFFFASFEKAIQHVQNPLIDIREAIVPTAAMRMGDFTNISYDNALATNMNGFYAGNNPCPNATYTPAPAGGPPNNCIAFGRINPAVIDKNGQILLNVLPQPNLDPTTHQGFNYISAFTNSDPRDQELLKLDYNVSGRNHLSLRGNHESETVPFPYGAYNNFTLTPYPGNPINHDHSNSVTANLSTTITQSLVNEITATDTRLYLGTFYNNLPAVSRSATGYSDTELFGGTNDVLPNVAFGSCSVCGTLYVAGGTIPPYGQLQQTFVISDNVTKVLGRHIIKGGIYYARLNYNIRTQGNENGSLSTEYYSANTTNNAFADLLTGNIGFYAQSSADFTAHMLNARIDTFLQDTWKVTPRFTFNYGLRADHIPWWKDTGNRIAIFDPALYNPKAALGSTSGLITNATNPNLVSPYGATPPGFEIAPNVGFAYDFLGNGSTIFRGGFGTNYYADPGTNAFATVQSPPNENFFSLYQTPLSLSGTSGLNSSATTGYPTVFTIADQYNHRVPVTRSYNLAVAQQLPGYVHFEVSYTGNGSHNLVGFGPQNVVPEGCELAGGAGYPGQAPGQPVGTPAYAPGTYNDQLCRPYANLQALPTAEHNLASYFNSLQVTATRQRGRYNIYMTYTYGKALAYTCENPFDERRCYAPPSFDKSQALNISYFINLPDISKKYLGNHKLLNAVLDGYSLSGIEQVSSGNPIKVIPDEFDGIFNRTISYFGVSNPATGVTPSFDPRVLVGTPDETAPPVLVCDPRTGLHKGQFFNGNCFHSPSAGLSSTAPALGSYSIPYIHGPYQENDTLGLYKVFKKSDTQRLELRAEAFNFLNHPQYTFVQYDNDLSLTYNQYNAAPTNASTAGYAENKIGTRIIQLAAKYFF